MSELIRQNSIDKLLINLQVDQNENENTMLVEKIYKII